MPIPYMLPVNQLTQRKSQGSDPSLVRKPRPADRTSHIPGALLALGFPRCVGIGSRAARSGTSRCLGRLQSLGPVTFSFDH